MLSRLESFYTSSNLTEFTSERVANIVEFQDKQSFPTTEGTKLDRFFPKNQHTQRKLLNFENWVKWGGVKKWASF